MTRTIDPTTTMEELLQEYPAAQRALFRAYHIGGCASCGFDPNETLASVCARNENLSVAEVVRTMFAAQKTNQQMQSSHREGAVRLQCVEQVRLIDVRSREECDAVHIEGATCL